MSLTLGSPEDLNVQPPVKPEEYRRKHQPRRWLNIGWEIQQLLKSMTLPKRGRTSTSQNFDLLSINAVNKTIFSITDNSTVIVRQGSL